MEKYSKAELIYVISCVAAFALLFFANADTQEAPDGTVVNLGIGKSFYFPCGVALISSFFLQKKKDGIDKYLNLMIFFAIFSSLIHPPHGFNVLSWTLTRFLFAILCFRDLRNVSPLLVAKAIAYAAPIIVFPHYILKNPFSYGEYRYGGFYGDPNFLALAFNLIIAMCFITILKSDSRIIKLLCIASILGAIPLIMAGMSRGGLLGLFIILYFIFRTLRRHSKRWSYVVILVCALSMGSFTSRFGDLIESIEYRFIGNSASDAGGARARIEGIESVVNVMMDCPYLIPLGIGLGNTVPTMEDYRQHGYFCKYAVHNTYFSLWYEAGLILLFIYLLFNWETIKTLYCQRNYMLVGVQVSAILSLFTLPGVTFMPGWILLFLLSNKNIERLQI